MPKQNIITGQKINPAKLEQAKAMRRAMPPAERQLWSALRANRLDGFHFRRQQVINGFIVDFYCHAAGLVVEVDGAVHDEQVEYDAERSRMLAARGLQILRVKNEEVMQNLENVLIRIRAACLAGSDLTPRPPCDPLPASPYEGEEYGGLGERSSPPLVGEGPGERSTSPPRVGEGLGEGSR